MMTYARNINSLLSTKKFSRTLHKFSSPRPEVMISNNSGLFVTLQSLFEHGHHIHPKLIVYATEHWIEKVHPNYLSLDWGQTPRALPRFARQIFLSLYKNHSHDKPVTWLQYQTLREQIIADLIKQGITVIRAEPKVTIKLNNYHITSEGFPTLTLSHDTHFYNTYKTFLCT
jgi:hypothetical protein